MINTDHLHPIIIHFPIAIIIVGFAAEVVSLFFKKEKCLSKTGFYLLSFTAVSFTGFVGGKMVYDFMIGQCTFLKTICNFTEI